MVFTLDIGGTYTKYALVEHGTIIRKGKWETIDDFSRLLNKIDGVMVSSAEYIGISSGGFWNKDGSSIGYETVESTAENNLKKALSDRYGCPVYLENDARCALLAEQKYGVLKDCWNAVLFVLGSSLGCAVMIDGKLFSGSTNQAGAMFLMPEYYDGECYRFDTLANSIELTKEYDASCKGGNMLLIEQRALASDEKAEKLIDAYAKAVALKGFYAYLMYDPQRLVLGGGISDSPYITAKIRTHLDNFFEYDKSARKPTVVTAGFGNDSNLLGASLLGAEENKGGFIGTKDDNRK